MVYSLTTGYWSRWESFDTRPGADECDLNVQSPYSTWKFRGSYMWGYKVILLITLLISTHEPPSTRPHCAERFGGALNPKSGRTRKLLRRPCLTWTKRGPSTENTSNPEPISVRRGRRKQTKGLVCFEALEAVKKMLRTSLGLSLGLAFGFRV